MPPAARSSQWTVLREIQEDPYGRVFLAVRHSDRRPITVRILSAQLVRRRAYVLQLIAAQREVTELRHPNVAAPLAFDESEGSARFIAERPAGKTLAETLAAQPKLQPARALQIINHVLRGLEFAARHHVLYGRLDPDHVLLADDGRALLLDFGLPYAPPEEVAPAGGPAAARPDFLAPEQLDRPSRLSDSSDVFACGAVLYAMLTGAPPFRGETTAEIVRATRSHQPPPVPDQPSGVRQLVSRMLAKDPDDRYAGATEALRDVEAIQEGRPPAPSRAATDAPSARHAGAHTVDARAARGRRRLAAKVIAWGIGLVGSVAIVIILHLVLAPRLRPPRARSGSPTAPATPVAPASPAPTARPQGQATPVEGDPPHRLRRAQAAFEAAEAFAAAHVDDTAARLKQYRRVTTEFDGTLWAARAAARIEAIRRAQFEAMNKAFQQARERARELAREDRYGAAIQELRIFVEEHSLPAAREQAQLEMLAVREQANTAFDATIAKTKEMVERARAEAAVLRPLAKAGAAAEARRQRRARYDAYRKVIEPAAALAGDWSFKQAAQTAATIVHTLRGSQFEAQAQRERKNYELLASLKAKVIRRINRGAPGLRMERISRGSLAGELRDATDGGFALVAGPARFPCSWRDFSADQALGLARLSTDPKDPDDRIAIGVLALHYGMVYPAHQEFQAAQALGADASAFFDQVAALAGPLPDKLSEQEIAASRLLLDAEASFKRGGWRSALGKLYRLKNDYLPLLPGVQLKTRQIDSMMGQCRLRMEEERLERDLASGRSVPLLGSSLAAWEQQGRWSLNEGGVLEGHAEEADSEVLRPYTHPRPYSLTARVQVFKGRGLLLRPIGRGERHVTFGWTWWTPSTWGCGTRVLTRPRSAVRRRGSFAPMRGTRSGSK